MPSRNLVVAACLAAVSIGCNDAPTPRARPSSPAVSASPSPSPEPSPRGTILPPLEDPSAIAAAVTEAERAIRNVSTPADDMPYFGRVQQAAYRRMVESEQLRSGVMGLLPEDLRPVAESNVTAGAELRALTKPLKQLPDWNIVEPPPAETLKAHYQEAESVFGIPWRYLAAIHLVESRMGRLRGTSSAGAQGPMQFLPSTWEHYGEGDINDPHDAILAAGRYLKAHGGPGNMDKALYRYNPTPRYVKAVSLYAGEIQRDERAYLGYYHWQVYVRTTSGDRLLEVGYGS